MDDGERKSTRLRQIFSRKGQPVMHVASAPTAYAARMIEKAGFEYIFLGGDVTFGTMLAMPGTYLTMTEKVFIAKFFVRAVSLPVVMDCDEVCGRGPAFLERAVEEYIGIGLAGMDIDDRIFPEGSGAANVDREHGIRMGVVPTEEMVEKIRAASLIRQKLDPDFVIRVRCYDFHGDTPLEKIIERLQRYEEAGADVLYLGGVSSPEDTRTTVSALKVPCTVPATWMTYELASKLNLCEYRQPYELEMAMHAAGWEFLSDFQKNGTDAVRRLRERFLGNPYMAAPELLRTNVI
ncbi:isocitrate lyase/phosphoenolpyruvate mutase family protein [Paraburkholderia sp.]|uniref:isocitrate lyase/phosphoenolpyruvate mutase family protein n=1 Tax=Paraburkholderia sp. TaxID=1926495 RepID=UPI0039E2C000